MLFRSIERAQQLKRQQKILREMEWAARPEYEKRRTVVSVDIVKGKAVKRYGTAQADKPKVEEDDAQEEGDSDEAASSQRGGPGAFGKNPLVGGLIKPVWKHDDHEEALESKGKERDEANTQRTRSTWRRVQDDQDDNESWILDGGTYGGRGLETYLGAEEQAVG